MATTAQKFESVNADLQRNLKQLMNELSSLSGSWKGRGAVAFEQVKLQYAEDLRKLNQNLTETAEAIRAAGINYTATDSDAGTRFNQAGGGLDLPLVNNK